MLELGLMANWSNRIRLRSFMNLVTALLFRPSILMERASRGVIALVEQEHTSGYQQIAGILAGSALYVDQKLHGAGLGTALAMTGITSGPGTARLV